MAISEREWKMIIIVSVLVGLATISAILRLFARYKLRVRIEADDYLCFTALFLLYGMLIQLILWVAIGGNGTHIKYLSPETLLTFGKIFIANQFTYFALVPILKISFISFYRRIFFTSHRFNVISCTFIWIIGIWGAGIFLICALQCRPLRGYWDKSIEAHCINGNVFFIVNQGFNVVMDFVILALPLPIIFNLKRAWQDKLALTGIFALGGFVCFASIYRIVVLFYIDPADPTHTVYRATLWTHIEPSVGLICSCLPTIRGLFPAYRWHSRSSPYPPDHHDYINSSSNRGAEHLVPSDLSKNSVYIMMEDGVVKPEQDHGWVEDRHDIEENEGRREGGIVRRTDTKVVQGLV
ncbi:hypothetical protein V501_04395 [Pseudogymnoascus sp. VKM F-4519 (FW-2642)]|nr:hypothetical protein V501_04395 [Pseudogymnoascus sp. VKM F-4519 (FW-2642)]